MPKTLSYLKESKFKLYFSVKNCLRKIKIYRNFLSLNYIFFYLGQLKIENLFNNCIKLLTYYDHIFNISINVFFYFDKHRYTSPKIF